MKKPADVAREVAQIAGGNHPHRYITRAVELIDKYRRINSDVESIRKELIKHYGLASKMVNRDFIKAAVNGLKA
ncbi:MULTISPECIES: hypothetical protein [Amycolatopsis]|uniref:Uncharacterized protein n=1 Tax=Amycolatopsis saalfeldensis TaxID=394193 RepID=A0A1H8YNB9_9PSEU|nr:MULTISPECIES: hypothetical protein [Amycolatopsis]SEP53680.1 hypothetical protein SAMN04489732_129126 [Amycolatopsis saalfeldensis]